MTTYVKGLIIVGMMVLSFTRFVNVEANVEFHKDKITASLAPESQVTQVTQDTQLPQDTLLTNAATSHTTDHTWDNLPESLREAIRFKDTNIYPILDEYFASGPSNNDITSPQLLDLLSLIYRFATNNGYYNDGWQTIRALFSAYEKEMDLKTRLEYRHTEADLLSFDRKYTESYTLFKEIHPQIQDANLKARNLSQMGFIAGERGQFDQSAKYLLESATMFKNIGDQRRLATTYNRIGLLYERMANYDTSVDYMRKQIEIVEALADSAMMLTAYSNIGIPLMEREDYEEALIYYGKSYDLAEERELPMVKARVMLNIGNIYKEQGNYNQALQYYQNSLKICEEIGLEYGVILNQLNIGTIYFEEGRYKESEPMLLAAYDYFKEADGKKELSGILEYLYNLYDFLGETAKSQQYMREYIALRDDLYNIEKTELTENLRFRYETDLKDQQLLLLDAEVREKVAANRALIFLSILLVGLMVGSVSYYRHRNHYLRTIFERNVELMHAMGLEQATYQTDSNPVSQKDLDDKEERRNRELFEKIKETLQKEELYKDPELQLSKLSKKLGTNERYLSQAILSVTGLYYNHYINFHRVNAAKKLILNGEKSMAEVQFLCGFNSRTTFYTAFKKVTGMSPSQFLLQSQRKKKK